MKQPQRSSLDWYGVCPTNVIKMANTKLAHVAGAKKRALVKQIAAVRDAAARMLAAGTPSTSNPAWCKACDATCEAAWALLEFADPL
jgi:hypothetical protein